MNNSDHLGHPPTANGTQFIRAFGFRPHTPLSLYRGRTAASSPFLLSKGTAEHTTIKPPIAVTYPANTSISAQTATPNIHTTSATRNRIPPSNSNEPLQTQRSNQLPTPVNPDRLQWYLDGYNEHLKNFIVNGFRQGFSIHSNLTKYTTHPPQNARIANQNPEAVDEKLTKEIQLGHIAGPFTNVPFTNFHMSPLSLRPKDGNKGWRLLHDLSFPYNEHSVNSTIPDSCKKVKYSSVADAIQTIQRMGKNTHLAKTDIQSAFSLVPLAPDQYHLMGFHWRGQYYYYTTLPQGGASSCFIFQRIASALLWILRQKYHITSAIQYLDDFLFLHPSPTQCRKMLHTFHEICQDIGIPINHTKTEGPSSCLTFLGIQLDAANNKALLPIDKVTKYTDLMSNIMTRNTCKLHEMQKLIGSLQFTTSVVLPGRTFLRRMINTTIGVTNKHHHVHVNKSIKKDIQIWLLFLKSFNGISIFIDQTPIHSTSLNLYTDSCPTGFGGTYKHSYFFGPFPTSWRNTNIAVLELYPIMLALQIFASDMSNKHIVLHTDNRAVADILHAKTTRHPQLLGMLRNIVLTSLKFNILISSKHIPGKTNTLADALSRNKQTSRMLQEHQLDPKPIEIPQHLRPENYKL